MKRHHCLQPLSREHHLGLSIATHAKRCQNAEEAKKHWQILIDYLNIQMKQHFAIEDTLMAEAIRQSGDKQAIQQLERAQHEHQQIALLCQNTNPTIGDVHELAEYLYEHIRFEERALYPMAEILLDEATLQLIYQASNANVKFS